jgi:hypothetical protein
MASIAALASGAVAEPHPRQLSHNKSDKVFFSESFQLLAENKIPGQKRVVKHMLQWLLCLHLLVG